MNKSKGWNITLWVVQVLLAGMFIMAGSTKLFQPMEALAKNLPWTTAMSAGMVRGLGLLDLLGGLGLLLPSLLRIQPRLSVLAAIGLVLLMGSAIVFHATRGESEVIGFNLVLLAAAVFVAWGRSYKAPVYARA